MHPSRSGRPISATSIGCVIDEIRLHHRHNRAGIPIIIDPSPPTASPSSEITRRRRCTSGMANKGRYFLPFFPKHQAGESSEQ